LETAEAEVEASALQRRAREPYGGRVATGGEPVDHRPARIAEAEELRGLVERLPDRVVAGAPEADVIAGCAREVEPRVAARDDECKERERDGIGTRTVEIHGEEVPFEM